MDFTDLKDYVYLKWEAVQDGIIIEESIQKELPSVLPHTCGTVYYTGKLPENGSCFLRVRYLLKSPVPGLKEGWELGFDEIRMPETAAGRQEKALGCESRPAACSGALTLEQTERRITVTGADFTYVYDTFSGAFSGIRKGEKEYSSVPWSTISGVPQRIMTEKSGWSGRELAMTAPRCVPIPQRLV